MACRTGCSHCCSARVEAFAPEIFRIAEELKTWPAQAREAVAVRMRDHVAADAGTASWSDRPECPFLVDRRCSVYAVRPSACRKAHSLAVEACAANAPRIPQSLKLVVGTAALTQGTLGAYAEAGFDASQHEMVSAVLTALDDPTAEARWCAGEPVFGPRGTAV
ncbi:MAG: YkgJ family cysteine cluster protein [Pseudomonadota bacterium]|nr:YkgJ family cysteine cluster protein [Pseudomonadota bacterium]